MVRRFVKLQDLFHDAIRYHADRTRWAELRRTLDELISIRRKGLHTMKELALQTHCLGCPGGAGVASSVAMAEEPTRTEAGPFLWVSAFWKISHIAHCDDPFLQGSPESCSEFRGYEEHRPVITAVFSFARSHRKVRKSRQSPKNMSKVTREWRHYCNLGDNIYGTLGEGDVTVASASQHGDIVTSGHHLLSLFSLPFWLRRPPVKHC